MVKYLIVGPSWIGDMIMANGLFRLLKLQHPDCVIDVLAPAWSHPVLACMPEVRRSIMMPVKHGAFNLMIRYQLGKSLRDERYDYAVVLPNSWKSALIPFFARIPKRIGWRGEWRYGILNDVRILNKKKYPLMIQRYLALGNLDANDQKIYPHLKVDFAAREIASKKYQINQTQRLLILCPGAQYGASKRWPIEYFAKVADYYLHENWQVAVLGGKDEKCLVDAMNAALSTPALDLTAATLAEAIDLMSLADAVVSNDSGLMHVACALDRNVVAIYGSSSPDFTPPLHEKAVILSKSLPCKPCFKRECPLRHLNCLKMITPEEVIKAIGQ
ncbi:MAG: lipopolysaccharide heptosyltransferase II [Pseudomonadota bacterium]